MGASERPLPGNQRVCARVCVCVRACVRFIPSPPHFITYLRIPDTRAGSLPPSAHTDLYLERASDVWAEMFDRYVSPCTFAAYGWFLAATLSLARTNKPCIHRSSGFLGSNSSLAQMYIKKSLFSSWCSSSIHFWSVFRTQDAHQSSLGTRERRKNSLGSSLCLGV